MSDPAAQTMPTSHEDSVAEAERRRYTELLKRALTGALYPWACYRQVSPDNQRGNRLSSFAKTLMLRFLDRRGFDVVRRQPYSEKLIEDGSFWPYASVSMIGRKRMDHLQHCVETALAEGIEGDLMECGVWRGGAVILMQALLDLHDVADRRVVAADSFEGMPRPDTAAFPADALHRDHSNETVLCVSLEQVKENIAHFGFDPDRIVFLKGWFKDTLPNAPVDRLAVLRLDADLYESTMQIFENLYHRISPGGFVIVDDYGSWEACRIACHEFRERIGETAPIEPIDWSGAYWRKSVAVG